VENKKSGYVKPCLITHGLLVTITKGKAVGKGPAELDGSHAQPNSKCPSGDDGMGGCEFS
jgi:hypothetical protein